MEEIKVNEIRVNEYIRTKEPYGEIFKVVGIGEKDVLVTDSCKNNLMATDWVKKHSENILDLIEIGDYVNGELVASVSEESVEIGEGWHVKAKDIKSIVTHESFNSIKYEVE